MRRMRQCAMAFGILLSLQLVASSAYAALCVWVNPDRDIKKFFPGANSYNTEIHKYSKEQEKAIEKRINAQLDPDENEFKFYRVKKSGKVVGTVLTHQARGKYGAVQVVVAIGNDKKTIGVYVQRHREPTNLNQESFLKQFKDKTSDDPITVGKDITSINGHDKSSQAVAYSVKKILVVHDVLSK
ncbi:MAG: hypothetical protein ACYC7E_02925 [Armatimonadota bacterium]